MMNIVRSATLALAFLTAVGSSTAQRPCGPTKDNLQKTASNDVSAAIDINNIFNYYTNNGDGASNPYSNNDGFELMNANRGQLLFEEGFIWGGIQKNVVKVGGSTYNHGLQAGPIVTPGTATSAPVAANPADVQYRVYRVRPDIGPSRTQDAVKTLLDAETATLSKYETTTAQQLYEKYIKDWNEWPAQLGAPFKDVNGDGAYDPGTDIPGVPGADQTLWYVANDNDSARVFRMAGSKSIGLEFQRTVWAYNRTGALGTTLFEKNVIINKSGVTIDSMFVAQWADTDIGGTLGFADDFTGCDTIRNLGFGYNASNNDGFFGSAPPAIGFDFVQGPRVKTGNAADKAISHGQLWPGYKNLCMSAFQFFVCGSSIYAEASLNNAAGTKEWYNLLNGFSARTGAPFIDPVTGRQTKLTLSGDPILGKGWIDGLGVGCGDRKIAMCSGPFTMAAGDTQEIVLAVIGAQSTNRLSSVALLKYYDDLVQSAYDDFFQEPVPPVGPIVAVTELDKKIVLDWSDPATSSMCESQNVRGYRFEGYEVYQLAGPSFSNAKRLATLDIKNGVSTIADEIFSEQYGSLLLVPVHYGFDLGLSRYFVAEKDYINDRPFVNGRQYYFAVTAYNYNSDVKGVPVTLESAPNVLTVVPRALGAGYAVQPGAAIAATHAAGSADGNPVVTVINPKSITGHSYEFRFTATDSIVTAGSKAANTKWSVIDVTSGETVVAPHAVYGVKSDNPIAGGMQFSMVASPYWIAGKEIAYLAYAKSGTDINTVKTMTQSNWTGVNAGLAFFGGGFDVAGNFITTSSLIPQQVDRKVEIRFNSTVTQNAYCFTRTAFTGSATAPYTGFFQQPFTVWDITDAAAPRQLDFAFMETDGSAYKNRVWAPGASPGDREYLWISNETYTAAEKSGYTGKNVGSALGTRPILYGGSFVLKDATKPAYQDGDVFRVKPTVILTTSDVWAVTTRGLTPPSYLVHLVPDEFRLDQNFPNPFNPATRIVYTLPVDGLVSVRVYDVMGRDVAQLVSEEKKAGTYMALFDGSRLASGVYYCMMRSGGSAAAIKMILMK